MKGVFTMKKTIFAAGLLASISLSATAAYAVDLPDIHDYYDIAQDFSSQYQYKEGDVEKTFAEHAGEYYSSGIETREDGVEYEFPIMYFDEDAKFFNDYDLQKGEMALSINGGMSDYGQECVLFNGTTLVPVSVFEGLGCTSEFLDEFYVTRLSKGDTVLEIIPQSRGMRKNQAEGYYVPMPEVARYVDGVLYVPLRTVAEQLGITVGWNGDTKTVTMDL